MHERTEEVGADVQTQRINKEHEAERLAVRQHLLVYRKPYVAGKDADEEYKSNAQ